MTVQPTQQSECRAPGPHLTPYFAYAGAFILVAAHVAIGLLLKIKSSGVIFQTADQVAMAGLGVVLAGLVCACPGRGLGRPGRSVGAQSAR